MQLRYFITSSNFLVVAGKNSKQNEQVVKEARGEDLILHTEARGSPFCVVKARKEIDEKSINEAANFCAAFSKEWKRGKKSIEVHVFKPADVYKRKGMAEGTYGVKKVLKKIKVTPKIAIGIKTKKLQCSPESALDKILVRIEQGKLEKEKAAEKILKILKEKSISATKEAIMQIIPASRMDVR